MSLFDVLIIYLACGAPVSVAYYFQNRAQNKKRIVPLAFFVFLAWLPFILKLSFNDKNRFLKLFYKFNGKLDSSSDFEKSIFLIKKQFEDIIFESGFMMSVFEFREIFERFVGLVIAVQNESRTPILAEENIFQISGSKNTELSAICVRRRNRKRLVRHQIEARRDFLQLLKQLIVFHSEKQKLGDLAIEFVTLLDDIESKNAVNDLLIETSKPSNRFAAELSEKILWNKETHRPAPAEQISSPLKSLTAITASYNKD